MREFDIKIHKLFAALDLEEKVKRHELRFLLDELYESDVSTKDWRELYESLIGHLPEFKDKWDLIRFIYRFLNLRYDYIVAERVTWKLVKRFDILFTKYDSFYGPTSLGIELFESLMNPLDKQKSKQHKQLDLSQLLTRVNRGMSA